MGNDIEDERAIREDQSKGSWELNRSIDERRSLALIMTVSKVIITITTRPKPAYGWQGLAGSWGAACSQRLTLRLRHSAWF